MHQWCVNEQERTSWQFVIVQNKFSFVWPIIDNKIGHNIVKVLTAILTLCRMYDEIHDQ